MEEAVDGKDNLLLQHPDCDLAITVHSLDGGCVSASPDGEPVHIRRRKPGRIEHAIDCAVRDGAGFHGHHAAAASTHEPEPAGSIAVHLHAIAVAQ